MATADEYAQMSAAEKKKEDWMNSKWRPMMGWLYMAVCAFDFVLFPILWSGLQAAMHATQITQWQPLTLQGAGLFHIAMGAVLGIAAMGRTQEKLAGANNGGAGAAAPSSFSIPPAAPAPAAPVTNSFGSQSLGGSFGSTSPATGWGSTPMATTASGKKIVPDEPQPAI